MVLEVDVAVRSIIRRLFQGVVPPKVVRRVQRSVAPNSIRWEFLQYCRSRSAKAAAPEYSHDKLETLHPADLADIVEELSPEIARRLSER